MDDEHRLGLDLEEATRCGHGATRVVHERLGLEQREPQPIEPKLGELTGELRAPAAVEPPRELVHHHPADVVAVALVLAPGVSQPDDEQVECRGRLAPTKQPHGLALGCALLAGGVRLRLGRRLGGAFRCLLALRHLALGQLLALCELLFLGLGLDDLGRRPNRGEHRLLEVVEVAHSLVGGQVGEPQRVADRHPADIELESLGDLQR